MHSSHSIHIHTNTCRLFVVVDVVMGSFCSGFRELKLPHKLSANHPLDIVVVVVTVVASTQFVQPVS